MSMFTLPAPISDIAYHNKAVIYDAVCSKPLPRRLLTIAADTKRSRGAPGHHRRAAYLGFSLDPSSTPSIASCPAVVCRSMVNAGSPASPASSYRFGCSRGCFGGCYWKSSAPLTTPAGCSSSARIQNLAEAQDFAQYLSPLLRTIDWVVYAKRPFAGPEAVLAYLVALHPSGRHQQPPAHCLRSTAASPSSGRTIAPSRVIATRP